MHQNIICLLIPLIKIELKIVIFYSTDVHKVVRSDKMRFRTNNYRLPYFESRTELARILVLHYNVV